MQTAREWTSRLDNIDHVDADSDVARAVLKPLAIGHNLRVVTCKLQVGRALVMELSIVRHQLKRSMVTLARRLHLECPTLPTG